MNTNKSVVNNNDKKIIVILLSEEEKIIYENIENTLDQLEFLPGRNRTAYQLILLESIKSIKEKNTNLIEQFDNPTSDFYKKIKKLYQIEKPYELVKEKYSKNYAVSQGCSLYGMSQYIMVQNSNPTICINKNYKKQITV